jgi:hypothetical protein
MRAAGAFQRAFFNPELDLSSYASDFDLFCRWEPRRLRYQVLWAFYTGTVFQDEVHLWSQPQKQQNSLYSWARPNFNPVPRIVEFGAAHIVGGPIDPEAGDGTKVKSALPIDTKSPAVRRAISRLWRDSLMIVEKDILARKGTALGDIGLKVCDDPRRGRVTLKTVHPGTIKWVDRDRDTGRVLAYLLEETRYDPLYRRPSGPWTSRDLNTTCTYNEEAWIEGGKVRYRTYRNGALFDWKLNDKGVPYGTDGDAEPEWDVPYGFVPLVLIQHLNVGLPWGLAEAHTGIVKFLETADVGSNIGDSIRRILNAPLAISGADPPDPNNPNVRIEPAADATTGNPEPGRTKQGIIWLADPEAKVQFTAQPVDIPGASGHVGMLREDIRDDYPEINEDLWKTGDPSGKALWIARQRPAMKVQQRRVSYDLGLRDAQSMAMAMGGKRSYEGYRGLGTEDPFNDDLVAHSFLHRPVFESSPLDEIEERLQKYTMIEKGRAAGFPLPWLMEQEGEDPAEIAKVTKLMEEDDAKALEKVKQRMDMAGGVDDPTAVDVGGGADG